jgi:hypothetical protein
MNNTHHKIVNLSDEEKNTSGLLESAREEYKRLKRDH